MKVDVDKIYGKKLEAPAFCEDKSDFCKLLISTVKAASGDDYEDAAFFTMGMRIICHEYLALVLSGKMEPFSLPEEFVKKERDHFHDIMHLENEMLQKGGVPLKEGENGKVEIDIEEIKRRVNG